MENNQETTSSDSLLDLVFDKSTSLIVYIYPLVSLIGLVGNIVAFQVFSRKKFANTVFATYFRFLTITDTISLLLPLNKFLELNMNIRVQEISMISCKLKTYLTYVIPTISVNYATLSFLSQI